MARPKKVMARTSPATMVTPTKTRPTPASAAAHAGRRPARVQGRLVKGSRRTRRGELLRLVDLLLGDRQRHALVLGLALRVRRRLAVLGDQRHASRLISSTAPSPRAATV